VTLILGLSINYNQSYSSSSLPNRRFYCDFDYMIKKIISIIFGQINKIIVSNNENVFYNQS